LVYAVITHWNALDDTNETLRSTLASSYSNIKAVIVDNGSTDGSPDELSRLYPHIPLIKTGKNGSITKAYNLGVRYALDDGADYILMLNNDIKIDSRMVELLMDVIENNPEVGIVTPKIYYYDEPDIIWFAGGMRSRFDFGSYETSEGEKDGVQNSISKEVDYAWACGMLMSREVLEKIGLFDTRFYLYYDDVDISYRTQQFKYKIWYEPDAKMWHKVSHSTGSERFTYIWARSKMRLYRKHTRGLHQISLIFYTFLHSIFRAIIPRQDNLRARKYPLAYFRGLFDGLKAWKEQDDT
ncbi:MAG TPA: glycosyltransferase family 2 protein, partial [Anaerolineae bacterium]|nr:glycosyltransferase family 2 protein [Anaerolineae bacterium]